MRSHPVIAVAAILKALPMSVDLMAVHSGRFIMPNHQQKDPAVNSIPRQSWRRNSPTSLIRAPLRFTSEEDRQCYRQGIRTLALLYVGILALLIAVTAVNAEWRKQVVTAKTTAGASDIPRRY